MNLIQIYQNQEDYGIFTYNQDKEPTEIIKLCRSRAEGIYENDVEDVIELEQEFIDQLEEEGIIRVFINHEVNI